MKFVTETRDHWHMKYSPDENLACNVLGGMWKNFANTGPRSSLVSRWDSGSPCSKLTRCGAIQLEKAEGDILKDLCNEASLFRDKAWGRCLTYSRKIFVPLTNMCRDSCGYCSFVKHPESSLARIMTPEQVRASVQAGERAGCKEVLFSLGEKPELKHAAARQALERLGYECMTDYLRDMCELVLEETDMVPHVNAGTLTEQELAKLRQVSASMGLMLESVSRRLLKKGQAHHACPDKVPKQRIRALELAGEQSVPFTTGILIGIGETWEERVDSLLAINQLHQRYGHIQEVIVQNFRAKSGTAMAHHPEPGTEDLVRTLAVARLLLDPSISLQVPPNLTATPQTLVQAGINDWGGVSPVTADFINPERRWPEIATLREATNAAGYTLQERLTVYPRYSRTDSRYLAPRISARVSVLSREDGLAATQYN